MIAEFNALIRPAYIEYKELVCCSNASPDEQGMACISARTQKTPVSTPRTLDSGRSWDSVYTTGTYTKSKLSKAAKNKQLLSMESTARHYQMPSGKRVLTTVRILGVEVIQ